jgi:hypothetical protein
MTGSSSEKVLHRKAGLMSPLSVKSIVFSAVGVAAVATYVITSSFHIGPFKRVEAAPNALHESGDVGSTQAAAGGLQTLACTKVNPGVSIDTLNGVRSRARELADQKRFAEALPEFRNIATVDPGFPGVNLDISVSLLQLKHTQEAKQAIDSQIAISDCLAKAPPEAVDAYCKAEMFKTSHDGCVHQLQGIRQSAHYQAALIQMEMGQAIAGDSTNVAEALPPAKTTSHAKVVHAPADVTEVRKPAQPKMPKNEGDNPLQKGTGTDLALGAYSKN